MGGLSCPNCQSNRIEDKGRKHCNSCGHIFRLTAEARCDHKKQVCGHCSLQGFQELGLPPTAARMVARVMAFGAVKYKGHESYLTDGRSAKDHIAAADRHVTAYELGELLDHESGEHPLGHAAARILMALETELRKEQ